MGLRVAVLDRQRLVAEGIGAILQRAHVEQVIAAVAWAELLAHPSMPVDVVVIDPQLGDGILLATRVSELRALGTATVVMSAATDARSVARVMDAGALGFVAKSDSIDDLVTAITAAGGGATHLPERRSDALLEAAAAPDAGLGRQEERALVLYAAGRTINEVADAMQTTAETVKSYIKRGRRKYRDVGIDVGTRLLLRRFAVREGWLPSD